jgi:hypothetical protein
MNGYDMAILAVSATGIGEGFLPQASSNTEKARSAGVPSDAGDGVACQRESASERAEAGLCTLREM